MSEASLRPKNTQLPKLDDLQPSAFCTYELKYLKPNNGAGVVAAAAAAAGVAAGPPWRREQRLGGSVRRRWLRAPGDSARGTSFYKLAPCVSIS